MRNRTIRHLWIFLLAALAALALPAGAALSEARPGEPPDGLSPTTGLPTDQPYRPFLVVVSNVSEARPCWNLSEADIVYEMIIWGPGYTRFLAVYNDEHPEKVGSLRSARHFQAELRQAWDCPMVCWGGMAATGAKSAYDVISENRVDRKFWADGTRTTPYSKAMFRDPSRVSPHNAGGNLRWMLENAWPRDEKGQPYEPRLPGLAFSDTPTQGGERAPAVEIHYEGTKKNSPNHLPRFAFNEETGLYERSDAGNRQFDGVTGKRLCAANVLVQYCDLTYPDNVLSRPSIALTGEGRVDAYIDGHRIEGIWRRADINGQTEYLDGEGNPLVLKPGKTFIEVIPTEYGFDHSEETGTFRYAPDL